MTSPLPALLWASILILLAHQALSANTLGPLGYISIASEMTYSTMRPCAAGCLVYQGIWHCGVNGGYNDLGIGLGCGCSPINNCYCSAGLASSATSYLSSCVSNGCSKYNWQGELTSVLSFYDGYCATANVAVSTSTGFSYSKPTPTGATTGATSTDSNPASAARASASTPTATATASASATSTPDGEKHDGLSKADIVALAASLGIGIPSLAIAAWTLWLMMRKRRIAKEAGSPPTNGPASGSDYEMLHTGMQTPQTIVPSYAPSLHESTHQHQMPNQQGYPLPPNVPLYETSGQPMYEAPGAPVVFHEAPGTPVNGGRY